MKIYISILFTFAAVMLTACSGDDEVVEKTAMDNMMFQGQWFSEDNGTFLNLGYTSFHGVVYDHLDASPVEGEILSGTWLFFPANNMIRMSIHYENAKFSETRNYKVLNVSSSSMTLLDTELNAECIYYKVAMTTTMLLGEDYDITIPDFNATAYHAVFPIVAEVSDRGRVKTHDEGTAFVKATAGTTSYYVRINVGSRVDSYYNELLHLTIDEIKARYGTPTYDGPSDTPNMVISFTTDINDRKLNYIHYRYDADTRQVTQIQTMYEELSDYNVSFNYLMDNYYDIYGDGSLFCELEWVLSNDYYIQPIVKEDNYVILYSNYLYFKEHGYY